ncbi:aminodeoxychorismate synthase, component I [Mycobacterium malmoense]|nr:aminodeoxychorismate synthase, component I [Mycobacterium malmoense]
MKRRRHATARLDDITDGRAYVFNSFTTELAAHCLEDVVGVLGAAESHARQGGWAVGFVAYDAARAFDSSLRTTQATASTLPLAWFGLADQPAIETTLARRRDPDTAYRTQTWIPAWNYEQWSAAVDATRALIGCGEIYQCNLTTRLAAAAAVDPIALYTHLLRRQSTPYGAFLDIGSHTIASASPELFFEWTGDCIATRPMKGTATRGATSEDDEARRRALTEDEKERAENLMIVDLLRNDLAKISGATSIHVTSLFHAEQYRTLWQLTSEIRARIPYTTSIADIFRALFPCGSVTGAPKCRSMQVIAELEDEARGVYCGAIGLIGPNSVSRVRARFSVAIRTAVIEHPTGRAIYGSGGGITWSSNAKFEYLEMLNKASILHGGDV